MALPLTMPRMTDAATSGALVAARKTAGRTHGRTGAQSVEVGHADARSHKIAAAIRPMASTSRAFTTMPAKNTALSSLPTRGMIR